MASYYSNYDLNVALGNVHALKREVEKKLEFAKKVLKSIAGTRTGTDLTDKTDLTDGAGTEAETREDRAELTREEMIAAAKNVLVKLANGKDWK